MVLFLFEQTSFGLIETEIELASKSYQATTFGKLSSGTLGFLMGMAC